MEDYNKEYTFAPILIVEDEEDHALLIIKSLKDSVKLINEIYHVDNGQKAIDFLRKEGEFSNNDSPLPVLILLDIKMPMKNGFEVLKEVKNDKKLKNIPVVMLTTTSTEKDIDKAILLGANDFIVKPVSFNQFTKKVNKLGYYWGLVSDIKKIIN